MGGITPQEIDVFRKKMSDHVMCAVDLLLLENGTIYQQIFPVSLYQAKFDVTSG